MEKQHIYFIMAHPDDLVGCMGLAIAVRDSKKFRLHVMDLTRGEKGLYRQGISMEECAKIRFAEETEVCKALGVTQVYLDEIDGQAYATREVCERVAEMFRKEVPRAIVTHWPVDSHNDHVMCGAVSMKAAWLAQCEPEIYFCNQPGQTHSMPIAKYFPFSKEILEEKAALIRKYKCQNGDWMAEYETMEDSFHGLQTRTPAAECYGIYRNPLPGTRCFFDEL